jgi:predicted HTH transcriptional regulator
MSTPRLSPEELRRLLQAGESEHVEFKQRLTDGRLAARELAALANSGGGWLIVGVRRDTSIVGVEGAERTRELIESSARNVEPRPALDVYVDTVEGATLVVAHVDGGTQLFVGPDGAISRRTRDGHRLAFSGTELESALRLRATAEHRPADSTIADLLDRMNQTLAQTAENAETERAAAAGEREAAQRARGWRSRTTDCVGGAIVGIVVVAVASRVFG